MDKMKKIYWFLSAYLSTKFKHFINRRFPKLFFKWKEKKLDKHLRWIAKNSPYYREILKDKEVKLENFPIMDKSLLMDNLSSINTRGIDKVEAMEEALKAEESREFKGKIGDVSYGLSSGTSGNRGLFLVSDKESAMWAGFILAKIGHFRKHKLKKTKIAFFMRANNNLYETIDSFKFNFRFFDIFKEFDENLRKLDEFEPHIIIAQPSVLSLLAKEYKKGRTYPLIETFTIAEVLDEQVKVEVEEVFNVPNYNIYQATEGFLGCNYRDMNFYLNEDLHYIEKEYISEDRFIPIITDLYRTTQPIIRYRLNDICVAEKSKGEYNFTKLTRVEGRSDEYFIFENNNKIIRVFPDFIRNAIIKKSKDLIDYKVFQHEKDKIEIILDTDKKENIDIIKAEFNDLLNTYEVGDVDVICKVEGINREKGIKLRRIFRNPSLKENIRIEGEI